MEAMIHSKPHTTSAPGASLPSISTKKPKGKIAIKSRKSPITVPSNRNLHQSISTKSNHPTSIKKAKGKMKLLELLSRGMDLPCAVAAICLWASYKSRSTVYKWIEEDPEFADQVLTVEMAVLGFYQMLEMEAATGRQLLRETMEYENYYDGKVRKVKERVSRRWAKYDVRAIIHGLDRRLARLKRIQQAKDKAKALMEID